MPPGRLPFFAAALVALSAASAGATPDTTPGNGPAPTPHTCGILDRGFIQDGITTITELQAPGPCTVGAPWNGWYCVKLRSDANAADGPSYNLDVRWNLNGQSVAGSFTWMIGGASLGFFRDVTTYGPGVEDALAAENIRTIEIAFGGRGVYTSPANGYPNISAVYADVLEYLVATGIADTSKVVGHYGNSGGGLMAANALAFHRVEKILDGVVFGSSPFWNDLEPVCTDPSSPFYGAALTRARADTLNWLDANGTTPCTTGAPDPEPSYACRSLLGPDADVDYPDLILAIVIGQQDPGFTFIDPSAHDYYLRVNVYSHTYTQVAGSGHQQMDFLPGANTVQNRIETIVANTAARKHAPQPAATADASLLLRPAAPNPLRDGFGTELSFALASAGPVLLDVHDVTGRLVASLLDTSRAPGEYSVRWNGTDDAGRPVAAGLYFARLRAAGGQRVTRIQVIR